MSAWRAGWLLPLLVVGGCSAKLSSSLPASVPPVSYVGARTGAFAPDALEAGIDQLQQDLERVAKRARPVPAQLSREGHLLKLRLGAGESFGPASAELQAAALEFYAQLAEILVRHPGTVAHILVHDDTASGEPSTDLAARRANSLQSYLAARGVPGTRLRAEGRGGTGPRIELWLVPIVVGREAAAWMAPS